MAQHFCCSLCICELLLSFIDLLCELHIYTRAVLCGATYLGTVKLSKCCVRLLFINRCLYVPKSV